MHYKIFSYGKCVCFLFLIILFVFNCSGFRIDDLPMTNTDNRKHSFPHTSSSSSPFGSFSPSTNPYVEMFDTRQLAASTGARLKSQQDQPSPLPSISQHKIRHRHRPKMYAEQSPNFYPHLTTSQLFPATSDIAIASPIVARNHATDSSNNIHKRSFLKTVDSTTKRSYSNIRKSRRSWKPKQTEEITWRAYRAEFVLHAEIIAQKNNSSESPWIFRVVKSYKRHWKGQFVLDVDLRTLQDPDHMSIAQHRKRYRHQHPSDLQPINNDKIGQHYILFLNSSMMPTPFKSVASPKLIKLEKFNDSTLKRVCSRDFRKFDSFFTC